MDYTKHLEKTLGKDRVLEKALMKEYTTFKVGGPCNRLVFPQNLGQLKTVLSLLTDEGKPFMILGKGSDLLVRDEGYNGTFIKLAGTFYDTHVEGTCLRSGPALSLESLSLVAADAGLSGLEFANGIPGSVGGGVFMNAGAYDGEIRQVVHKVKVISKDGSQERTYSSQDLELGYRRSIIEKTQEIVLEGEFHLIPGEVSEIYRKMDDLMAKRKAKQPWDLPSAGSFFKRPEGYYAGKLIQDSGLQGLQIGGAQVSTLHAGFIVNRDGASAQDIITLMHLIQYRVKDKFGVELEPEVRIIGGETSEV